ncbi:hypothetical protein F511_14815 [Dorcoceras hygrometricum]|uniref:Retrotransposon gag domain-containing protein n=1 Tax=Dorcoceras hygrometricum TaxID=472368 RepID=A0A2Z7D517_9LAMI|nr:hypothetical protein F511_14815 [Dorcoceras hygrometricum]
MLTWDVFCEAFRREYTPESYFASREREFDNLKQGDMRVAEYARRFSALLVYMPAVANQERTRNKFLKGLRPDLYRMVLSGSPATFMEAVNNAVDIEESLMDPKGSDTSDVWTCFSSGSGGVAVVPVSTGVTAVESPAVQTAREAIQ